MSNNILQSYRDPPPPFDHRDVLRLHYLNTDALAIIWTCIVAINSINNMPYREQGAPYPLARLSGSWQ